MPKTLRGIIGHHLEKMRVKNSQKCKIASRDQGYLADAGLEWHSTSHTHPLKTTCEPSCNADAHHQTLLTHATEVSISNSCSQTPEITYSFFPAFF